MEPDQKKLITDHLDQLIQITTVSVELVAYLTSKYILSVIDVEELNSKRTNISKSLFLYDLLITRSESYNVLLESLEFTKQTGALEILYGQITTEKPLVTEPRIWRIPDVLSTFSGRKTQLQKLDKWYYKSCEFVNAKSVLLSPVILVHGTAGVGKTELCIKWLHELARKSSCGEFHAISFNMKNKKCLLKDLHDTAQTIFQYKYNAGTMEQVVLDLFQYVRRKQFKVFFLLDNCNDKELLKIMIPKLQFSKNENYLYPKTLVTSQIRNLDTSIVNRLYVSNFEIMEASDYVDGRLGTNNESNELIKDICTQYGNHPLAVENTISFILEKQRLGVDAADLVFNIQEMHSYFEKRTIKTERVYHTPLCFAWDNTLQILRENHGLDAERLLNYLAFTGASQNCFQFLELVFSEDLKDVCKLLASHNLVTCSQAFEIQPIIREVLRRKITINQKDFSVLEDILGSFTKIGVLEIIMYYEVWKFACKHNKLVSKYFSVCKINNTGYTPLHVFVEMNDSNSIDTLLENSRSTLIGFQSQTHKILRSKGCPKVVVPVNKTQVISVLRKHKFSLKNVDKEHMKAEIQKSNARNIALLISCICAASVLLLYNF